MIELSFSKSRFLSIVAQAKRRVGEVVVNTKQVTEPILKFHQKKNDNYPLQCTAGSPGQNLALAQIPRNDGF